MQYAVQPYKKDYNLIYSNETFTFSVEWKI